MIARLAGYRRALVEAGIEPDPALVVADIDAPDDVVAGLDLLRSRGVDSVFFADPRTSIAGIPAIQSEPLPVVGFGDFPLANLLQPSFTVIDQDPTRMGSLAVAEILSRLARGQNGRRPPETTRLPVRLIERDSCRFQSAAP
ncbi:hypothetical protein AX769_00660 [Frondihabitans sp. PAMC 28766]|nr:hypothetical protein AX769_00660 [Frondihabitans sp. PAMC 28766]